MEDTKTEITITESTNGIFSSESESVISTSAGLK